MDVLIVSKTRMKNASCVGGVLMDSGRLVRLLDQNGHNQPANTDLEIGDVRMIRFRNNPNTTPPHIEDILVSQMSFKSKFDTMSQMEKYLLRNLQVKVWKGNPTVLFDGKLQWTHSGSGYICTKGGIPTNSVGFWISDNDLKRDDGENKIRDTYLMGGYRAPFGGFQTPIDVIPKGTLIRVSLARWWSPPDVIVEKRCYLQISGWYKD